MAETKVRAAAAVLQRQFPDSIAARTLSDAIREDSDGWKRDKSLRKHLHKAAEVLHESGESLDASIVFAYFNRGRAMLFSDQGQMIATRYLMGEIPTKRAARDAFRDAFGQASPSRRKSGKRVHWGDEVVVTISPRNKGRKIRRKSTAK